MAAEVDFDVLIVGAGPTGVTLGALLAQNGVSVLVIDKAEDIYPLPRAAHIDHEAIRIYQQLGIAEEIMTTTRSAERYDFLTADGDVLLRFEGADRIAAGGWPGGNMIHQPSIEASLRRAALALPGFTLKTSTTWISSFEDSDHVVSTLDTPEGQRTIRSRFIVGCDGARSPVRAAANIDVEDLQFDEQWLVIDAIVRDPERLPRINLQICDPARPTTCVLMGSGRHRWEFMMKPGETAEAMLDDAFIADLLKPWSVDGAISLERKVVYRFNARVAKQWRKGRTVLAGDAAHLMPPFAGQGLCSGLRDAANLAWKLAAMTQGATNDLLETYQPEREPNVRAIIGMAIMMGRTVCITDPEAARARDQQMLTARATGAAPPVAPQYPPIMAGCIHGAAPAGQYFPQPIALTTPVHRLDDVLGAGAWLISRTVSAFASSPVRIASLDQPQLTPFREQLDGWFKRHDVDAVLVRPDRYVFGAGPAQELQQAWAGWVG